jgi:hypothetical protein
LFAAEDTARLKAIVGKVEYMPKGTAVWQAASEGLKLYSGDTIKTGADGLASIVFTSGSEITLKPNTDFKIISLTSADDASSIDYKMQLNTGRLRAMVEELGPDSSFEIKTPTAVAAIRGTIYYLAVRELGEDEIPPDVKERLVTELFVEVGGVLYTNIVSGKYFAVSASQTSRSYVDGSITVPIEVPPDRIPEWTEGWELLAPEAYESTEGADLSDLFTGEGGGESDPRFGDTVNQVVAAAIAQDEELNFIWQEMYDKLLDRYSDGLDAVKDWVDEEEKKRELEHNFLRASIYDILDANRERRLEKYMEEISDAQTGSVLTDIYGKRVRMQQYILRPATNVVEVLNVNLRADNDLTTMAWATTFNQSLDALARGQLKTLPWNDYLTTIYVKGVPHHINSPYHESGLYPAAMSVMFEHGRDSFTEARRFGEHTSRGQNISEQTLVINNGAAMPYAFKGEGAQPAGTYSITKETDENRQNAYIGGVNNNPLGFDYNFADASGAQGTINAAFYVMSNAEASVRQDYPDLAINSIWDALRVDMPDAGHNLGNNNLEMVFSSSAFQGGVIDLIYVPFMSDRIEWK